MEIWKNTSTLDGFDDGLIYTESKSKADIALMGGKPMNINEFPNLKGIFRAGIGRDNVPEKEAEKKGIIVRYPSKDTIDIIFEETASFTSGLIFRMLFDNVGSLVPWVKKSRRQLSQQNLLVIGTGRIGSRVAQFMKPFMKVSTFDILHNKEVFPWYYPFTKAIANGIALISGVPGGLFDPSLSVGAGFGQLTANWLEINNATPVIMAFMVAYFSGVVQSPITAFVIVIEMTGAHHMVLPLCITSMIACNCSKLVCKQGLYDALAKLFMDGLEQYQQKHAK